MTTAGKATFDPARGGSGKNEKPYTLLSKQFSSKDMPGQLKLKYRQPGQDSKEELKFKDFRQELIERELEAKRKREAALAADSVKAVKDEDAYSEGDSESSESDNDEAETAALLAELKRIRQERAEAKTKKEAQEREQAETTKISQAISGNPLLDPDQSNFLVKRKWNDDVIFKNCAKDKDKDRQKPYFINDMLRSEFHRRFMDKYVK